MEWVCHTFMGLSMYVAIHFYALYVCVCVFAVRLEWENCISLWEIIIYQVRLTISLKLLSRSRTAECPEMRFLMDGCHRLSRAWWMFSHLGRLIDWANWIEIPYFPDTWWLADPIPILASDHYRLFLANFALGLPLFFWSISLDFYLLSYSLLPLVWQLSLACTRFPCCF